MIIGDFNFVGIFILPPEAHSIPLVDSYAVLSCPVAPEAFEPVPGGNSEFIKPVDPVQLRELPAGDRPECRRARPAAEKDATSSVNRA
jgi:hypothetical protein